MKPIITGCPEIKGTITLCGSTRFKEQFMDAHLQLTLQGWAVYTLGTYLHTDKELHDVIAPKLEMLENLHKYKIQNSHAIMIIDVDDYIGESTTKEYKYASSLGVVVYSYSRSKEQAEDLSNLVRMLNLF